MIVDDQIFNIRALRIILNLLHLKEGIEIVEAMNGIEAVQAVKDDIELHNGTRTSFVFIMMDSNMPFMDGCTATQEIRSLIHRYNLCQPIISAVTGHSEQLFVNQAIKCGMNQVLSKPISQDIMRVNLNTLGLI